MAVMVPYAVTDELLAEMVRVIVAEIDPERIILFGSRARGDARPDSDVDLLIVRERGAAPRQPRYEQTGQLYRLLSQFRVPKDILLYTPAEMSKWSGCMNHVISYALREGRVLYERA